MSDDFEIIAKVSNNLQKPNFFYKFLPNYNEIREHAAAEFEEIKKNISICVQAEEIQPGLLYWTRRLTLFIHLHGYFFTKDDHLKLIRLYLNLLEAPFVDLIFYKVNFEILTILLKKKDLIGREDLVIEWRPFLKMYETLFLDNDDSYGLVRFASGTMDCFFELLRCARSYFPASAANEIFEHFMPRMCPFDTEMRNAVAAICTLMPATVPVNEIDSLTPWIWNLMELWIATFGTLHFDSYMISIFARFAYAYAGYLDWDKWMSAVFTRIHRSFRFAPMTAPKNSVHNSLFVCTKGTIWIVYMIGGKSQGLSYLRMMFNSFKPFYYNLTFGKTQKNLQLFVERLCCAFVDRLYRERIRKKALDNVIPENYRIKESEIDEFVDIVKDYVLTSVLLRRSHVELSKIVHALASLRPAVIIPQLVDRFMYSLEVPTEPQRFLHAVSALAAIPDVLARNMSEYPKSRLCLIRIIKSLVVGIDINDQKRLWATLHLYFLIFQFTAMVDFSSIPNERNDLKDYEIEFCMASAEFKNVISDLLERIFQVVLNLTHDSCHISGAQGMSDEESEIRDFIQCIIYWILQNCSYPIFELVRDKIIKFISGSCFTPMNTAILAGALVNGMVEARPREVSSILIPKALELINKAFETADEKTFKFGDPVLTWNMRLLSECMLPGAQICPYVDEIIKTLKSVVYRCDTNTKNVTVTCLKRFVSALCDVTPTEERLVNHSPDQGLNGRPAFENWGQVISLRDLHFEFHVFSEEENKAFVKILDSFLYPELQRLHDDLEKMDKDQRVLSAQSITSIIVGGAIAFPRYSSPFISNVIPSNVPHGSVKNVVNIGKLNHPAILEARMKITDTILAVVDKLAVFASDDVTTMKICLKILGLAATYFGFNKADVNQHQKVYEETKRSYTVDGRMHYALGCEISTAKTNTLTIQWQKLIQNRNKSQEERCHYSFHLLGRKLDFRSNHILRARNEFARRYFHEDLMLTEKDVEILLKLFRFSASHYSEVRKEAQAQLSMFFNHFRLSSSILTEKLCHLLGNSSKIAHDELKGYLYVLLELSSTAYTFFYNWTSIEKIWPAIAASQQAEKPSAQCLVDKVFEKIRKSYSSIMIYYEINDSAIRLASALWQPVKEDAIRFTKEVVKENNTKSYEFTINQLICIFKNTEMKWKSQLIAFKFLTLLLHRQYPLPSKLAATAVDAISHENFEFRKLGQDILLGILRLKKHKAKKVVMKTTEICGENTCLTPSPGIRPDNQWLQLDLNRTEEESYSAPYFLDKTFWGYYMWPRTIQVSRQERERCVQNCSDECAVLIYEKFIDENFVSKVLNFHRIGGETKRKFSTNNFKLYRSLFRNYGPNLLSSFFPPLKTLIADKSKTQDKSLVCVAEILGGMLRGSKNWTFDEVKQFWTSLYPMLESIFNSLSPDSEEYFVNSLNFAMEDIDPRRNIFLIRALIHFMHRFSNSNSFLQATSVSFVQATIQLEWRGSSLWRYLFDNLKSNLQHPYKNVRSKVSDLIAFIASYDVSLPPSFLKYDAGVSVSELMTFITERCHHSCDVIKSQPSGFNFEENGSVSEEYKTAISFIDSVLIVLTTFVKSSLQPFKEEIMDFLPMLCELSSVVSFDTTLSANLKNLRLQMSCCYMKLDVLIIVLNHIENVLSSFESWHARKMALSFLQLMIFTNLANAVSLADRVTSIFINSLQDEKYEVKIKAVHSIAGLMHCGFIQQPEKLSNSFINQVKKCSRKRKQECSVAEKNAAVASIFGLCAIILASPYEIPSYLPSVLYNLCVHMNLFNSAQAFVKRTLLEFRRSHQYNWEESKSKFTEDELLTLTDAIISPNYYA